MVYLENEMNRYIITVILLISVTASVAYAESIPLRLRGEVITISNEKITASGNIEVEYKDIKIKANHLDVDPKTWIVIATGDVVVTQEKNTLKGNRLTLFLKQDIYRLDDVNGEITDRSIRGFIYVKGNVIQRDSVGNISGKDLSFTTCDLAEPHYHIKAEELFIYPQERLFAKNVSFYIGDTRIVTLPYYNLLFDHPERQPIIPEIGNSSDKGYYIKTFLSHYQSRDLYGYATLEIAERTGLALGLTEYYNIKDIGPGFTSIYVLPTAERMKSTLSLMQEAKLGDAKFNGYLYRTDIKTNSLDYRLSASYKGYSLSTQGSTNETNNTSSYNTILSISDKIGDVNTSILARDRYYKKENLSGKFEEYKIVANTKVQDVNLRLETYTVSYPDEGSLSLFGYTYILTKIPELTLSSRIFSSQDLSINGDFLIGNYLEVPTNTRGLAIKGNLYASPKAVKIFDSDLTSSITFNGSYYPPQDYITGVGVNLRWSKEITKDLNLNLNYEYKNGWGNSQFNILSELPALPSNSISGNLVAKGENYSVDIASRFDLLSYTFTPITVNSSWKKDEETKISLNLSINPYYLGDITAISSISWRIDPKWKLETKWKLSLSTIQFQEIKITYDLHCWEMGIRYNSITQTTSINFSLKAIPEMGTITLPEF